MWAGKIAMGICAALVVQTAAWGAGEKFTTVNGIASMEAEHYTTKNSGWTLKADKSGYSGAGYMYGTTGAMTYEIYFTEAGTYYLHGRTWGSNEWDNTFKPTLAGTSYNVYCLKSNSFEWLSTVQNTSRSQFLKFTINSTGWHTLTIAHRGKQVNRVDKIVIHTDGQYTASATGGLTGTGPAETPYGGGGTPPAVYGDANGDGSVTMADLNLLVDWILGRAAMPAPGSSAFTNTDVDGDNAIGMSDLNLLVDYILGRITRFPAE